MQILNRYQTNLNFINRLHQKTKNYLCRRIIKRHKFSAKLTKSRKIWIYCKVSSIKKKVNLQNTIRFKLISTKINIKTKNAKSLCLEHNLNSFKS